MTIFDDLPRLRRIAREAQATYVGRHWPSMRDMRRDGIGYGLVEDAAHERFIRRYLDTFQPEFVLDLLDRLAAGVRAAPPSEDAARLREALVRMLDETYQTYHTPSSVSGPEEWDYTLDVPSIGAVEQAIRALAHVAGMVRR